MARCFTIFPCFHQGLRCAQILLSPIRPIRCTGSHSLDHAALLKTAIDYQERLLSNEVERPDIDSKIESLTPLTPAKNKHCEIGVPVLNSSSQPSNALGSLSNSTATEASSLKRASDETSDLSASKQASKRRRREKRKNAIKEEGHKPRIDVVKSVLSKATPCTSDIDLEALPATSCGYQAKYYKDDNMTGEIGSLQEALEAGYQVIDWNGR